MYLSYEIVPFFGCWRPEAAGEIILMCVRVQFNFAQVRKKHTYLLGRYIYTLPIGTYAFPCLVLLLLLLKMIQSKY